MEKIVEVEKNVEKPIEVEKIIEKVIEVKPKKLTLEEELKQENDYTLDNKF